MIRKFQLRCALLALLMLSVGATQAAPPAEAFAHLPTFTDLEISPGGKYLAARFNRGNRYTVVIFEILESKIKYVYALKEDDTLSVDWFEWASGDRLVASLAFTGHRGTRNVVQTEERRLFAIDAAKANVYNLFQDKRDEMPVQIQDRIVSWLPDEPNHILIQYSKLDPQRPNVYRVDVRKATRHRVAESGRNGVSRWMADAEGDVRLGEGIKNGKEPQLIVREKSEKKWKNLSHRVGVDGVAFDPLGFSAKPNEIYVRSNHEGDPMGLYSFDISSDQFGPLIYKHPSVDVSSIKLDPKSAELLSVNFIDDDVETVRLVEQPIHAKIREFRDQLGQADVSTRSVSQDGNFAVIRISGERDAGKYYLFSRLQNTAIALPPQYPDLADGSLGRTIATEYAARDGLLIPAFVTLPSAYSSLDELAKIPFVVRPHGGPGARDFMRFDYSVQFLASRGYGVLQMNFRGSTGYGQEFRDAGDREWGQAMQDDITDGTQWLIENGYADPTVAMQP